MFTKSTFPNTSLLTLSSRRIAILTMLTLIMAGPFKKRECLWQQTCGTLSQGAGGIVWLSYQSRSLWLYQGCQVYPQVYLQGSWSCYYPHRGSWWDLLLPLCQIYLLHSSLSQYLWVSHAYGMASNILSSCSSFQSAKCCLSCWSPFARGDQQYQGHSTAWMVQGKPRSYFYCCWSIQLSLSGVSKKICLEQAMCCMEGSSKIQSHWTHISFLPLVERHSTCIFAYCDQRWDCLLLYI